MTLFINACIRAESRTRRLAETYLSTLNDKIEEVRLDTISFPTADAQFLAGRDALIAARDFDAPAFSLARQFAAADEIVIAAPFWDLSFPASLKQYFEQVNVLGVTFVYTPEGIPQGLCRAKKLTYVTTAGGFYFPEEFGFGYVRALAQGYYGISEVKLIKALGLDIDGADPEAILLAAQNEIKEL